MKNSLAVFLVILAVFSVFAFSSDSRGIVSGNEITYNLSSFKADAVYNKEYREESQTIAGGYDIAANNIKVLGLEMVDIGFTLGSGLHTFVIKPPANMDFYTLTDVGAVYLCSESYISSDPRFTTTGCINKNKNDYFSSISLQDTDGEKFKITLSNYSSGGSAQVLLNGNAIVSSFSLTDWYNDAKSGCMNTKSGKTVCVLLDGSEQSDISLDVDNLYVTVKKSSASNPQANAQCNSILHCFAYIDLQLASGIKFSG